LTSSTLPRFSATNFDEFAIYLFVRPLFPNYRPQAHALLLACREPFSTITVLDAA
jgi:hypothetical protein